MKKVLTLLLTLAMLLGMFCACGEEETTTAKSETTTEKQTEGETTTAEETDEYGQKVITKEDLLALDFTTGGEPEEVVFATRSEDRYRREISMETTTDVVDAYIKKRNDSVEDALSVVITVKPDFTNDDMSTNVTEKYITPLTAIHDADLDTYDIVLGYAYYTTTATMRGYFRDYTSEDFKYLDLTQTYWNQNYIKAATVYDHLNYLIGDMNIGVWDKTIVCYANMSLAEDAGYTSLYSEALSGDWTIERMQQIVTEYGYTDLDQSEAISAGDRVALTSISGSEAWDGFPMAGKVSLLVENDDGTHSFNVSGNERLENLCTKVQNLMYSEGALLFNNVSDPEKQFTSGNALFWVDILYRNADFMSEIRSMDSKYGVLPLPKYDAEQETYGTTAQDAYGIMVCMTYSGQNLDAISATLEMMCWKSYTDVRPYYVEKILKTKYQKDGESQQTLEMIFDSVSFDTGTIYGNMLDSLVNTIFRYSCQKKTTIATRWENKKSSLDMALEDWEGWFLIQ